MTTYTWTVERMETMPSMSGHVDVVVAATWRCVAEDGAYRVEAYGRLPMGAVQPEFTEYAWLTESQVLGWVWAAGIDQGLTEAMLASRISTLQSGPVVLPNPW